MQEASVVGVLKIILIIALVYYGVKIITRIFGPLLLKYVTKKAGEKFQQQFDQYQQQQQPSTDGEINYTKKSKRSTSNKEVGEYIDYEEID
ncbi:DUF4834 family protein [Aquimarina hainanensis]|uniref:DUF4834 family protein n=1 Tax=Aquimarina hainanensis TaxID=1578017 RepID=A0ABW5NG14_9FLAO|nr:DUF4834 family protein [Aquimarina sp. TRL1]QKX06363.1 DUF4834 family protein [Aquimarina sp. TRL1]